MFEKEEGWHEWRFRVPLSIVGMSVDKVRDAQENGTLRNLYWGNRVSVRCRHRWKSVLRQLPGLETALGGEWAGIQGALFDLPCEWRMFWMQESLKQRCRRSGQSWWAWSKRTQWDRHNGNGKGSLGTKGEVWNRRLKQWSVGIWTVWSEVLSEPWGVYRGVWPGKTSQH